ncbi:hypothetical protein TTHERM_00835030 (macronuclear) [Tetrahymena thermophila SB210]|uniref:Uncharacterized protein n=1 Tax=Tetrahymena thermophila (strain SB210) TaxID=312017 RepID=Q22EC5_TETTS|nr:hypothetical protein TTHERM_00835030 [Tetrahymena thermophila SB210]EAR83603.2 hypothetical protein TTHERM_00835030 [Tetrahymena thermophila SB210]|eukprot:XP_001031266.2 hypothetical protein TTHERM_00835030 [Tetrahymena thermophila SB210]
MIQNYNHQVNSNPYSGSNNQFYHNQGVQHQQLENAQNQRNFRSPKSLENMKNLEQSNYQINKDTINNINKLPTTISFNQEGQFSIAKSIVEKDSFNNSKNSQIPLLSTYQGDPQELVNMLSGRVYQLVEEVHKLSSIIEEMTTNQQILSEKYVQLRAIYYQVLIDRNLNPSEKEQHWFIMNNAQKGLSNSSPNSPRKQQEIADQIRITSNNTSPYHSNQQSQQGLSSLPQQGALRNVQYNDDDNERVKKSRIKNLEQQQKDIPKSCLNCQQRELEQQILREHVTQMERNLNSANKEIQNLKQFIEIQQKQQNQYKSGQNTQNISNNFQDKSPKQSDQVNRLQSNSLQKAPDSQLINNYFKSPKNSQTQKNSPNNSFINIQKGNYDLNNSNQDKKSPKQQQDISPNYFTSNRTPTNFQSKLEQDYNNRSSNNQNRSPRIVQNQPVHNNTTINQMQKGNSDLSNTSLNKKQSQQADSSPNNFGSRTPKNVQSKPDQQDSNKSLNNNYLQKSNMELVYQNNQTPKQSQNLMSNIQNNNQIKIQNDDSNNIRNLIRPLQFGENYNSQAYQNKSSTPKSNQNTSFPNHAYSSVQNNSQTPKGNVDLNHHLNQIYNQNQGNNQPNYQIVINQYSQKPNLESNQMKSPKQNNSNVYTNLDTFNSLQPQKAKVDPNNVSLKDSIEVFKEYLHDQQIESMKKNNESFHNNSPSKLSKLNPTPSSNKSSKNQNITNKDKAKQQNNSRTNSLANKNNAKIANPQYQQNPK